jgi:hypothetical protein
MYGWLPLTDIFFCLTYIVYSFGKMKHFAYLPTLIVTTMLAKTHVVLRGVDLKLFLVILYVFKAYFACFSND